MTGKTLRNFWQNCFIHKKPISQNGFMSPMKTVYVWVWKVFIAQQRIYTRRYHHFHFRKLSIPSVTQPRLRLAYKFTNTATVVGIIQPRRNDNYVIYLCSIIFEERKINISWNFRRERPKTERRIRRTSSGSKFRDRWLRLLRLE